jgi:uncharacterized heparinase superfamily protein
MRARRARRASWRHHGRWRPVELAGRQPGEPRRALAALVEGCGFRARPLRQARGWGYQRLSALGTILVIDAAPPPPASWRADRLASTLALELSTAQQRLVVNCGGPGPLPTACPKSWPSAAHHRRAQHADARRHQLDRDPARRLARQGRRGRRRSTARGQ